MSRPSAAARRRRTPPARPSRPFSRYSFVAVTTRDLRAARAFWVGTLGCRVTQEERGQFVMVDAGGLRLCLDVADGDTHRGPGPDPVIGLKVRSVPRALERLAARGIRPMEAPVRGRRGTYARVKDPDGRIVIVSDVD